MMAWLKRVVDGIDEKTTDREFLKILDQRGRACTPPQLSNFDPGIAAQRVVAAATCRHPACRWPCQERLRREEHTVRYRGR